MSLFNKLTIFSILILLTAAFVAMPVMAHQPPAGQTFAESHDGVRNSDTQADNEFAAETDHSHLNQPAAPSVTLVDNMVGTTSTVKMDSVQLIADLTADSLALTDLTGANDGSFQVKITFAEPVYAAAASTTTAADADLTDADLTVTAAKRSDSSTNIFGSGMVTITSVMRMADDTMTADVNENLNTFLVTFQVDGDVFHDGTNAIADSFPIDIWINVNEGVLFNLDGNLVDGVPHSGRGNMPSMRKKFSVVDMLPETVIPPTPDTVKPTVTITPPTAAKDDGTLEFGYTISDETGLDALITAAEVDVENGMVNSIDRENKKIIVTPDSATSKVTVTVMAGALTDAAGNTSEESDPKSFTPEGYVPTITITSADEKGANDAATGKIVFTIDFSEAVARFNVSHLVTENAPELRITDLKKVDVPDDVNDVVARYELTIDPVDDTKAVKITIRAGVLETTDDNPFDLATASHTLAKPSDTPGTLDSNASTDITIKKESFLVVVRDTTGVMGTLLKAYDPTIALAAWSDMPDLQNVFETGVPLTGAAHGGGALILKQSGTTVVNPGTVGISEIMWAIDESQLNNADERKADQWIELHNLNTTDVTVKLTWKTGAKDIAADTSINGNLDRPYLDVVTNVFHDRPGNAHWVLPGQNGNPVLGKNFVSAARKGTFSLTSKHDNKFNKRYTRSDKQENASNSPDGRNKDQWAASTVRYANRTDTITTNDGRSFNVAYEDHGTPGRVNTFSPERADTKVARTNVPFNSVVFNEIANRSNEDYEWIELRNLTEGEINLKNYLISIVEEKPAAADRDKPDNDKIFYQFPSNDNAKIAGKGVFLLVASDPRNNPDHPLAVGYNVDLDDEDQIVGSRKNPVKYKVMRKSDQEAYQYEDKGLPDDGKFILILRKPDNHEGQRSGADGGKGVAERGKDDLDKIVDIAGYHPNSDSENLRMSNYPNAVSSTNTWPLRNFEPLDFNRNQFSSETVHHRTAHSSRGSHNDHRAAWQDTVYTGVGYKRQTSDSAAHGGSPGYHGNTTGKAADNKVIISEIMLSQGERGNLPQWIELYNPSKTHAVNLADNAGWRLVIENPDRAPIITINFKDDGNVKVIPPNQTVLIVSSSARDYGGDNLPRGTVFPNTRVLNAYTAIRGETFELLSRTDPLLNPAGFNLRLMDGKTTDNKPASRYIGEISDEIGSLDGNARTNDEPAWEFPSGMTEDGNRTSLIRNFVEGVAQDGMMAENWVRASDTGGFAQLFVRHTWYGDETDYGTPADRTGSVLPVSLSHFRPSLEDGNVVIRWTTESELDNAGFNILRSDTRNGEFAQVNDKLIAGKGTTGERSTYKWIDTTAKPGAVYYYQIEDVSFAGERQTLRTTKLKGLISAKGKLTTQWGELKNLR